MLFSTYNRMRKSDKGGMVMANNFQQLYNQIQNNPSSASPSVQFQPTQLFPQPQGNVYTINNSLEVANVPMGVGLSLALCPSESLLYIKTMQNGSPMFMAYKLMPYETPKEKEKETDTTNLLADYQSYKKRVEELEKKLSTLINKGGKLNELI